MKFERKKELFISTIYQAQHKVQTIQSKTLIIALSISPMKINKVLAMGVKIFVYLQIGMSMFSISHKTA